VQQNDKYLHQFSSIDANERLQELIALCSNRSDDKIVGNYHCLYIDDERKDGQVMWLDICLYVENGWMRTSVIDAMFLLLERKRGSNNRAFVRSQFFSMLLRQKRNERDEEQDFKSLSNMWPQSNKQVILPCNINDNHWLTIEVDYELQTVAVYDSLSRPNEAATTKLVQFLTTHQSHSRPTEQQKEWTIVTNEEATFMRQADGVSCGVFTIWYAYQLSRKYNKKSPRLEPWIDVDDDETRQKTRQLYKAILLSCVAKKLMLPSHLK
jgi:Ulp1 family protease